MQDEKVTPAMRQWLDMKARHPDKLLFFRMGDFYELFHNDAVEASRLLNLTLTKRGKDAAAPPLAGIPHHQLERYLREVMDKGRSAVVCDQLEDPAQAKGVVKRGITRVITPGTVVDDDILPRTGNNYLAAAWTRDGKAAAAFADISTGEFVYAILTVPALADMFERMAPAETLLPGDVAGNPADPLQPLVKSGLCGGITRRDQYQFDPHEGATILKDHFGVATLEAYGLDARPEAAGAAGAILAYLRENQAGDIAHLRPPRLLDTAGVLRIDRATIRNLELAVPPRDSRHATTLLAILDHTLTGPGSRLLRQWLLAPPARLAPIHRRQEAVAELLADDDKRGALRERLDRMADFERILARIAADRATPRDLAALAAGCRRLPDIAALADGCQARLLREAGGLDPLVDVADRIEDALEPDPPATCKAGGVIRHGHHPEVDELRAIRNGGRDWIQTFQEAEQARTGINSLKVGFNKVFGFYIEISNAHRDKAPPDYLRKQTLVNAERYIT
ncbi:MAG: DNA mismatch repair protein MutS, partial [Planctomycetes bacterium]|nr:DNA mismatch repair protein MutS [Planctomycetota bacterium]